MNIDELPEEDHDLFEHHHCIVDKGQGPVRIDKFLSERFNTSRNKIQNAAIAGNILVNGKPVKSNYRIKPVEDISLVLPYPKKETELIPEDIPLQIVYEDNDLVVVNKTSGMVVHPGHGNYSGTLLNALLFHFRSELIFYPERTDTLNNPLLIKKKKPGKKSGDGSPVEKKPGEIIPYLAHRIDKNTTGLIVVAKNEVALAHLAKQFFEKTIERKYNALVWGDLKEEEGTISGHIGRSEKDRKIMQVFPDGEYGKSAITHYKVLERFGYVTLVECILETGRTHQIRAHFKYIGHPLFNDEKYGGDAILKGTVFTKYKQFVENCFLSLPRQALHAKSLGFIHPSTKKKMIFDSNFPIDMKSVIEKWRNYAIHKLGA